MTPNRRPKYGLTGSFCLANFNIVLLPAAEN